MLNETLCNYSWLWYVPSLTQFRPVDLSILIIWISLFRVKGFLVNIFIFTAFFMDISVAVMAANSYLAHSLKFYLRSLTPASESRLFGSVVRALDFLPRGPGSNPTRENVFFSA